MSQATPTPVANAAPKPAWRSVMSRALLHPSITTYQTLVNEPGATARRALVWYFVASLVGLALAIPVQAAVEILSNAGSLNPAQIRELIGTPQAWFLQGAVGALFWLLLFVCAVGFTQLIAQVLGGEGSFQKFAFVSAAIWAPLTILNPLAYIPVIYFVTAIITLYGIVLSFIALKAVNEFDWGRTIIAGFGVAIVNLGVTLLSILFGAAELMYLLAPFLSQ
ncbi:MAG: hypothetical protein EYC68_02585 [Chloroflexota bacterium]|nr:MAG: hypothetical protein EYC68_02585 [Chloroflexota bacterium]